MLDVLREHLWIKWFDQTVIGARLENSDLVPYGGAARDRHKHRIARGRASAHRRE
jgi:hypothetical protein